MLGNNKNQIEGQNQIASFLNFPRKILFWELFLFCLILGLGISAAFFLNQQKAEQLPISQISFWDFLLGFSLATLFILFVSRLFRRSRKKGVIYKFLFIFISWWAGGILLSVWLPDLLAFSLMGILVFWRWKSPTMLNHNLCMVLGLAGVGSGLGIALQPKIVVVLLIIFSIYDFIAVYKTKHMQKMVREMAAGGAILALIVPQKFSDFKQSLEKVKPGGKFLILGGGDVVFPLLLCSSLVPIGILNSSIVAIFSLIGLFVSFWIFASQPLTNSGEGRQPIPALPPIALFSIIGFLISSVI